VFFDVLARVESAFNHIISAIHDPCARVAAVDKGVDATRQLLLSMLARRNVLSPISLLSPNVLAQVFYFLSLEEPAFFGEQNLGWIRATHVCRFWRQVALGDSSLWARISGIPTNTTWSSEMLARARNVPLDIDLDLGGNPNPKVLLMFPPHLSHTRELRLRELSMLHSDTIRVIRNHEAPALEHFELGVSATSPIIFQEPDGPDGTTLFKGQAPKLRTFSLSQVLIPWSLIPRGQLTQLKIVIFGAVSSADIPWDWEQLVGLLVNCPGLEILVLDFCLPVQLKWFPRDRKIHLPRLSHLCLCGLSSRIAKLFNMLKLPSSATLHFNCVTEDVSTDNARLLAPAKAHFKLDLQSPSPLDFKSLSISLSSYVGSSLEVTASTSLPTSKTHKSRDFESGMGSGTEFVLSFDRQPDLRHREDLLAQVCEMLPISNLEFLSISAPDKVDSVNWVDLFRRCTKVTTMQAIGCGTSSLVQALTATKVTNMRPGKKMRRANRDDTLVRQDRSTAAHAQAPIFPELTCLSLKRLDFAEREHPSGTLFDVVDIGLRQRTSAYGAPLKTLHIDNCIISSKRAKALQEVVQGFHWDRKEAFYDECEDFGECDPDFVEPGARREDIFVGKE
jgi:hypothetical protein